MCVNVFMKLDQIPAKSIIHLCVSITCADKEEQLKLSPGLKPKYIFCRVRRRKLLRCKVPHFMTFKFSSLASAALMRPPFICVVKIISNKKENIKKLVFSQHASPKESRVSWLEVGVSEDMDRKSMHRVNVLYFIESLR